ncbi:single-stranded DNA-binding protein [Fusibacter paucivorans]|uniref:Single-stranded DNA-binding protein n=1 Tax=Fusibacter paucivorans TaxID=76009 RepID=A0ABS5PSJ0_9FIRM|nr:single-stranded DNA-binding protein [Fusibacter paucivorans]MBS7527877.1 single-stranded DNA-binding protein [Fusibacter paucivorans]
MNNVSLIGRLVHDPDLKRTQDGKAYTQFNLAINRYMSQAQKEEKKLEGKSTADFPRIVAFGKTAENCCKYLQKGAMVSVIGKVTTSNYENNAGDVIYTTDITADRVTFLEPFNSEYRKTPLREDAV